MQILLYAVLFIARSSVCSVPKEETSFRDFSIVVRFWRSVEQLKHVINDLPQAALQRKVIVHQIDQEVVVVDILDDYS